MVGWGWLDGLVEWGWKDGDGRMEVMCGLCEVLLWHSWGCDGWGWGVSWCLEGGGGSPYGMGRSCRAVCRVFQSCKPLEAAHALKV